MEPAQFTYHLKQLVNQGLVVKSDEVYGLTAKGVEFIDRFDNEKLEPVSYPRVTVSLLYESSDRGLLLRVRDRRPGIGKPGLILKDVGIDVNFPLNDFADSAFFALTGESASFRQAGYGYVRAIESSQAFGNMLTHVFYAKGPYFQPKDSDFIWQSDTEEQDIFPSTLFILDLVSKSSGSLFYFEEVIKAN